MKTHALVHYFAEDDYDNPIHGFTTMRLDLWKRIEEYINKTQTYPEVLYFGDNGQSVWYNTPNEYLDSFHVREIDEDEADFIEFMFEHRKGTFPVIL